MKVAVFSCMGMGDGLIALALSNNLSLNGCSVTTFHPFLHTMQGFFPHLPIQPFPDVETLDGFERFFIIYEKSPWMQEVLAYCEKKFPNRTTVLNPIATPHRDYPYWENGRFDGNLPLVDNLYLFCKDVLRLPIVTKNNGIVMPDCVVPKRFPKRVIIHPTSSRPGKNWPKEKFLGVATQLCKTGYQPVFILAKEEKEGWDGVDAPEFNHLSTLATFIAESGYMIGNDSGIGHLASCLGLPTLTICRNEQTAKFWRPAWNLGEVAAPSCWVPNLKGLRWRDKHWKKWVSVEKVLKRFYRLTSSA